MKNIKNNFNPIHSVLFVLLLTACASPQPNKEMNHQHKSASNNYSKENSLTQVSENGHFRISLYSKSKPIPLRTIHDWIVHIETADGKNINNAKVYVFGGMPMHNHEFPTKPQVKEYLGNGDYRVEGIKFNMIGHWEVHFNIDANQHSDLIIFKIHL